jgi:hypothetical protein
VGAQRFLGFNHQQLAGHPQVDSDLGVIFQPQEDPFATPANLADSLAD